MSVPVGSIAGLAGAGGSLAVLAIAVFTPKRNIGTFIAKVTVSEDHNDELTITEHPVEQGASITDHAFKRPMRVRLRVGWSNSDDEAGGDPQYATNVYLQLLNLQKSRTLFGVNTGKRQYVNMLMETLTTITDPRTENSLLADITCREIIIVETVAVTVSSDQTTQTMPESTAPVVPSGNQQLQNSSAAKSLANGLNSFFASPSSAGSL